jgi:hypothetical protein
MIGFHSKQPRPNSIDRRSLPQSIAPELLQRFRHEVLFPEPMTEHDFLEVMTAQLQLLPEWQRLRYAVPVVQVIPAAVENGLGMRIFEEIHARLCTGMVGCGGGGDEFVIRDMLLPR